MTEIYELSSASYKVEFNAMKTPPPASGLIEAAERSLRKTVKLLRLL